MSEMTADQVRHIENVASECECRCPLKDMSIDLIAALKEAVVIIQCAYEDDSLGSEVQEFLKRYKGLTI